MRRDGTGNEALDEILCRCDLLMVRNEILRLHELLNAQAREAGGVHVFKSEYVAAWYAFRDAPTIQTSAAFIATAPPVLEYFKACCPGGNLYEPNRFIDRAGQTGPIGP